jgi:hypothetical protein
MIHVTLEEVLNSQIGLNKIIQLSEAEKIPFKVGFKTSKLIKKIEPEIKDFQEQQVALLKKYGTEVLEEEKDSTGAVVMQEVDGVQVPKTKATGNYNLGANVEKFNEEYKQLLASDVDLPNTFPYTLAELENVSLTIKEIASLEPFIIAED